MTKPIWSHSATVTPNLELEPVINGTRQTEPRYGLISEPLKELQDLIEQRMREGVDGIFSIRNFPGFRVVVVRYPTSLTRVVKLIDRVLHTFGVHRLVPHEEWDPITGEALDIGLTCILCTYTERE